MRGHKVQSDLSCSPLAHAHTLHAACMGSLAHLDQVAREVVRAVKAQTIHPADSGAAPGIWVLAALDAMSFVAASAFPAHL